MNQVYILVHHFQYQRSLPIRPVNDPGLKSCLSGSIRTFQKSQILILTTSIVFVKLKHPH
jgi:hypothetical protein